MSDIRYFILIGKDKSDDFCSRLNSIVVVTPRTLRYTEPLHPVDSDYPFVLIPIDDRAQSVLAPEEWASRLNEKPSEFIPPEPTL